LAPVPPTNLELTPVPSPRYLLALLAAMVFTLATWLGPWWESRSDRLHGTVGLLETVMGDSRRLFAGHFFAKADAYYHSGVYPSIFDQARRSEGGHLEAVAGQSPGVTPEEPDHADHDHASDIGEESDEGYVGGPPLDWIDRFGRHFYPTEHMHLESARDEKEILPWLRIAADLDPQKVETYTVGAYWLRRVGAPDQAERFLREGLLANPHSYELLFELGRLYDEYEHDPTRARNLWDLALRRWAERPEAERQEDLLGLRKIVAHLAALEDRQGHLPEALRFYQTLVQLAPTAAPIQRRIEEIRQALASTNTPPTQPAP